MWNEQKPAKRVFVKDMAYTIVPPSHSPNATAPSLQYLSRPQDLPNPTLLPTTILDSFNFVFLIRKPSASFPSLYRCCIPPLSEKTEIYTIDPHEMGYREMRILLDYLYPTASRSVTTSKIPAPNAAPILIDADDLLAEPEPMIRSLCNKLNFPYTSSMLSWDTPEDHALAESAFRKYAGYHDDALKSTGLWQKTADEERKGKKAETKEK